MLGATEIVPAAEQQVQEDRRAAAGLPGLRGHQLGADSKPDVQIDYMFFQKDAAGEKTFNRTPAQKFNARACRRTSIPRWGTS